MLAFSHWGAGKVVSSDELGTVRTLSGLEYQRSDMLCSSVISASHFIIASIETLRKAEEEKKHSS